MKLTMVIRAGADDAGACCIPLLTEMSLQQVLDQDFVQELVGPLMERHQALGAFGLARERATVDKGVITFDITDHPPGGCCCGLILVLSASGGDRQR